MQETPIITTIIIGSSLFAVVVLFVVSFMFAYARKHNRYVEERKKMETRFQQELMLAQMEIQEQTLKNIAQEIHDNIGQTLSLVKLNLNTLEARTGPTREDKMINTKELVSKAIHDLRYLSKSMNTDTILVAGLVKAIETELSQVSKAGTFQTELKVTGTPVRVDTKKELILFRIVQETVNNIIKHADAAGIRVKMDFTGARLNIDIHDDGQGFDPAIVNIEGSGLRNMKSRAELIGGRLEIRSGKEGTTITVNAPITER